MLRRFYYYYNVGRSLIRQPAAVETIGSPAGGSPIGLLLILTKA